MIKNFTKIAILCLIMGTSFTACKKDSNKKSDNSSDTYSMKLSLNGTAVTYNTCVAADITANGIVQFNIMGSQGNASVAIGVLADLKKVQAGQTFKAATDYLQPNSMSLAYFDASDNIYTSQIDDPTGSVTITSVSGTTIKGTFSGKLYETDDQGNTELKYTVTAGSFVAEMPK